MYGDERMPAEFIDQLDSLNVSPCENIDFKIVYYR